jgi:hypothetical protein
MEHASAYSGSRLASVSLLWQLACELAIRSESQWFIIRLQRNKESDWQQRSEVELEKGMYALTASA